MALLRVTALSYPARIRVAEAISGCGVTSANMGRNSENAQMPSDDSGTSLSWFDRLASAVSDFTSRAWFFAFCLLLVVLWGPSFFLLPNVDTWQPITNTVMFLLVALLQNTQKRAEDAGSAIRRDRRRRRGPDAAPRRGR